MTLLRSRGNSHPDLQHDHATSLDLETATVKEARNHLAKPGDLVIIKEHYTTLKPLILAENEFFQNRFGRFAHSDIIGRPLGRRINAQKVNSSARLTSAGFVHALAPTPELWAQAMDHRTQIVYPHDAALISFLLELRPGSVLVECGTGSGSASTVFARTVAPGKVYSFDFHNERAEAAKNDFKLLGIDHIVHVTGGIDAVKQGFPGVPDSIADAVFLDLPVPYVMGKEVNRVLRCDGVVCMFSPCIEQVQKTCQMLRKEGFHSLRTVTAPMKTYETREMKLETPGFDELNSPPDSSHNSPNVQERPQKRMRTETENESNDQSSKPVVTGSTKSQKLRGRTAGAERLAIGAMDGEGRHVGRVIRPNIRLHSKPFPTMKGHTSYLTFARKCTNFISNEDDKDPNTNRNNDMNTIKNTNTNGDIANIVDNKAVTNDCTII